MHELINKWQSIIIDMHRHPQTTFSAVVQYSLDNAEVFRSFSDYSLFSLRRVYWVRLVCQIRVHLVVCANLVCTLRVVELRGRSYTGGTLGWSQSRIGSEPRPS